MSTISSAVNQFRFPNVVASTEGMEYEDWKRLRMGFIGGSDAAAVVGLSRFKTPISVYFSKVEELPDTFTERAVKKMKMGHVMEPIIAELFAEETGKHVVRQNYFYQHPEHTFMGANIDFGIYGENAGLECKNSANTAEWSDGEVPDEYYMQCQHYMAVTGADRWYLAYLLEGWDFQYVTIERNDIIIDNLIQQEADFWNEFVVTRKPPAFDGSQSAKALLKVLYPTETNEEPIDLPEEFDALWMRENELTKLIKELNTEKEEIRNQISAQIGDSSTGISKRFIFTYKTTTRKAYTVAETSYRQLRGKARKI